MEYLIDFEVEMTELLVRFFVRDYRQIENVKVRTRYGILASMVGICCNIILFLAKMAAGLMARSISIMADAFNNLSDAVSSVVGFVGVKMAGKPADRNHPFGHGRVEYIAAFTVAFLVIQVAFSLMKNSVGKILHPEELSFQRVSVGILAVSVGVKLWLAAFNRKLGKRIDSKVMLAASADALGDVCATSAAFVSLLVFGKWQVNIDGAIGLVVSILVLIAGINIARDTLAPLIGEPIPPKLYEKITHFVEKYDGIIGSHDLIVHDYGPGRSMASIHAEVPKEVDIETSHEVVDQIERDMMDQLGIFLVIHMDPVDMENTQVNALRQMVQKVVKGLDGRLNLHDFRIVEGKSRMNLIFDLAVPREYTGQMQSALKLEIDRRVREQDSRCCCVITTEYSFVNEGSGVF